jgi:hypothetical protein
MDIGSAVGRKQGVSEQQPLDLDNFETSQAFSELEKLVLSASVPSTPIDLRAQAELRSAHRTDTPMQLGRSGQPCRQTWRCGQLSPR